MNTYAAICTYLFLLLDSIIILECKIGFPKDMYMDAVFPPPFKPSTIKGVPTGHLWHFGYQRKSSGKVTEMVGMPDAHSFHMKYVKQGRPLHIRESFKGLPVYESWKNDTYFQNKFGLLKVKTTIRKNRNQFEDRVMTLKKFLMEYMHEEWWLTSTMPYDIAAEVPLPECLQCGSNRQKLQEAELWMSYGPTSSRIHSREDHNLHCVLFGRKDFILIDGKHKGSFDFVDEYQKSGAGISKINVENVNMFTHSAIADAQWTHATVQQGDCIFVPAAYVHQIRSYGRGISFSILISPSVKFDSSDCKQWLGDDKKEREHLSDAAYVWVFRDAKRELSAMRMEPAILKKYLMLLLRADSEISYERFEHFYDQALAHYPDHPSAREAFSILSGGDKKTKITRYQMDNLNPNRLLKLAKILNDARAKQNVFERDEL